MFNFVSFCHKQHDSELIESDGLVKLASLLNALQFQLIILIFKEPDDFGLFFTKR